MDFIFRPFHYPNYIYYSSLFFRNNWPKLLKNSIWFNAPVFGFSIWIFLEAFAEQYIREPALENLVGSILSFISIAGILCFLIIVPFNHLKLYERIFSEKNFYLLENPTLPKLKRETIQRVLIFLKYDLTHFFYIFISLFFFIISWIASYLILPFIFILFQFLSIFISNFSISIVGIITLFFINICLYAICFGFSAFIPILILNQKKSILSSTLKYGFKHSIPILLFFFLEASMKIVSISAYIFMIIILSGIPLEFGTEYDFEILSKLVENTQFQEKSYFALNVFSWGIFNLFWDIFKAIFLSYIYYKHEISTGNLNENKLPINKKPDHEIH